jgi:hypothetical protein
MSLRRGGAVAPKHFRDLTGILGVIELRAAELAWRDHRDADDPLIFRDAVDLAMRLVEEHAGLLIEPEYGQDTAFTCPRCRAVGRFTAALPRDVVRCLGYC